MSPREFPFWSVAGSIAVGILLAGAIGWFVVEMRARWELRQMTSAMQAQNARARAERVKRQQERARADAASLARAREARDRSAARQHEYERRAERDAREGQYFPPADEAMPELMFACKDGQIVRRSKSGWVVSVLGDGTPARCRTVP
jgi:hypothetical protein